MRGLLIIPAYNEQDSIVKTINDIKCNCPNIDYIIVNDGSNDRTYEICKENQFPVINLAANLGLSGAYQAGMKYAYMASYDYAIQFDADGQHMAEYVQRLTHAAECGADIVIGSRFVTVKKPFSLRMLGSRFITLAIYITTGKKITDPTSGMRLFSKDIIHTIAKNINYGPEPDTIAFLLRNGAKITEVQVDMREREAGESYLRLATSVKYMLRMFISILLVQWFRKAK